MATPPTPGESSRPLLASEPPYRPPPAPSMSSIVAADDGDDEPRGRPLLRVPVPHFVLLRVAVMVAALNGIGFMFANRQWGYWRRHDHAHIALTFIIVFWSVFALLPHRRRLTKGWGFRVDLGLCSFVCGNMDGNGHGSGNGLRLGFDEPGRKSEAWKLRGFVDFAMGWTFLGLAISSLGYVFRTPLLAIPLFIIT